MAPQLTQKIVDTLTYSRTNGRGEYVMDLSQVGFGVRVFPKGRKVYIFRYRVQGKRRLLQLCDCDNTPLQAARVLAEQKRSLVRQEIDPLSIPKSIDGWRDALRVGHFWEEHAGRYFSRHGLDVVMPKCREGVSYKGSIDMHVDGCPVEIKSRGRWFNDQKDYGYPFIPVDDVITYAEKTTEPLFYVVVSRETGRMICISTSTKDRWRKSRRRSKQSQKDHYVYEAHKSLWRPIPSLVKYFIECRSKDQTKG